MTKLDVKKQLQPLYQPSAKAVVELDVPALNYLMVDGEGDPNQSPHYARAVEALFSVSYTAKFMLKKRPPFSDYTVMPLEGLWWSDDMDAFVANERTKWQWTMMILQPALVPADTLSEAMAEVRRKKGLVGVDGLRFETLEEGRCAQILHVGPFAQEGPTIERLHQYIDARSGRRGKHHEIYLSDIRRADPAKWRTIIRHPMQ